MKKENLKVNARWSSNMPRTLARQEKLFKNVPVEGKARSNTLVASEASRSVGYLGPLKPKTKTLKDRKIERCEGKRGEKIIQLGNEIPQRGGKAERGEVERENAMGTANSSNSLNSLVSSQLRKFREREVHIGSWGRKGAERDFREYPGGARR